MPETDKRTAWRPCRRRGAAVGACVVLAVGLAACGGGGEDDGSAGSTSTAAATQDGSGVAYAKEQVTRFKAVPQFTFDGEPFDMSQIKGKKIFTVPIDSRIPFIMGYNEAAQKVAEKYGAKWVTYTNQGQPNQWAQGINSAVDQKADVLILNGQDPAALQAPLERARSAGVKVVSAHALDNGEQVAPDLRPLVSAYLNAPFTQGARLVADYVIDRSGGKADVLIISADELGPSKGNIAAMKDEYAKHCPDCTVTKINVPATEWSTKITSEVQSALRKNPNINWVTPLYDSMSLFVESGLRASGQQDRTKIATFNGTPAIFELIQKGDMTAADVGESTDWIGWALMDVVGRELTGAPQPAGGDEHLALRIFDDSNVDEAGTPPVPGKGYGDAYRQGYEKIWAAGAGS